MVDGAVVHIVGNHFKSKGGDTPLFEIVQPFQRPTELRKFPEGERFTKSHDYPPRPIGHQTRVMLVPRLFRARGQNDARSRKMTTGDIPC
jgi:hypothetical protein